MITAVIKNWKSGYPSDAENKKAVKNYDNGGTEGYGWQNVPETDSASGYIIEF